MKLTKIVQINFFNPIFVLNNLNNKIANNIYGVLSAMIFTIFLNKIILYFEFFKIKIKRNFHKIPKLFKISSPFFKKIFFS